MPDPVARHSRLLFWAFVWYLRWMFWRRFHAIRVSRTGLPQVAPGTVTSQPVIVYCNHPSWWDPALMMMLQDRLFPGRTGFGPMDAKSLARYGVLERMGVFGIELDTRRGAAQFLVTGLRVLADPAHMLWVTAEGSFADARTRPVRLRPGLAHLLRRMPNAVVLPLALEYTFWNESQPEALARFGPPLAAGPSRSVAEWTECLEQELSRTMDVLAAESVTRDRRLFQPLLRGGAGVGGIYDLYRRGRAAAAGRRFDPSHEGGE